MSDSWAARLYQAIRNYVVPWPVRDTYVRVQPVDTDDEVQFYSDIRYLEDLRDAVLDDVHLARVEAPDYFATEIAHPLLQMVVIPVESPEFAATWNWPDHAATLISLWRLDKEISAWCDGEEILDDEAA